MSKVICGVLRWLILISRTWIKFLKSNSKEIVNEMIMKDVVKSNKCKCMSKKQKTFFLEGGGENMTYEHVSQYGDLDTL